MRWYLVFIAITFLFGCKQPEKRVTAIDKIKKSVSFKRLSQKRFEENEDKDSIQNALVVAGIIKTLTTGKSAFVNNKVVKIWKDTSINATVSYSYGHLFSNQKEHLIIKCKLGEIGEYYNCYVKDGTVFKPISYNYEWGMTLLGDTLRDVNGDGYKDFLINTYSSSGCCARNFFDVYLYNPKTGGFVTKYGLMNPEFFPKEKVIRGVGYGHPGEVPLYKYKWNGLALDTIEYIYPADTLKKKFYRVYKYGDNHIPEKREVLNSIPKEYRRIYGYDWFIDY